MNRAPPTPSPNGSRAPGDAPAGDARSGANGPGGRGRAVVLLSGGIDSAVALWWALDAGYEAVPLTYNYHLRPQRERDATRTLAEAAGCAEPVEVDLPFMREVSDMDTPLPEGLQGAPSAYVPQRNLTFYALAAHFAEAWGAATVVGGHNGGDPDTFPDSGPEFFEALNDLIAAGRWAGARGAITVVNPLRGRTKEEVLHMGEKLGVPFGATWSCYHEAVAPCGECPSCGERSDAFAATGLPDPALADG